MKCENCGFAAPVREWKMVEQTQLVKLPEQCIQEYEKIVDDKAKTPRSMKPFVQFIFRFLGEEGLMPYHETRFACPQCGTISGEVKE